MSHIRWFGCDSESSATNILQRLLQQLSSSDSSLAKTAARQASRFFYHCSGMSVMMRPVFNFRLFRCSFRIFVLRIVSFEDGCVLVAEQAFDLLACMLTLCFTVLN
jgi:hypothetical protein